MPGPNLEPVGLDAVIQGVSAYLANSQRLIDSNQKLATSTRAAAGETKKATDRTDVFGKVAVTTRGRIFGLVSAVGGLALAGGAVFAGVTLIKGFISEASEAQKIQAQTNAVIASTKGVAGVSAKAVNEYADALSRLIPVDDEAIQSGENMLLTFTKISSEMFPRATKAVLDMAVAFNHGAAPSMEQIQTTAIRVGKALQDPIKGATALRRVGVALTDQQEAQIKTMIEAGDIMGAQTVILKELETEFGLAGIAAGQTWPGQLKILRTQLGNIQEAVGRQLLPKLQEFTKWLTAHAPDIERFAKQGIVFTSTVLRNLGQVLSNIFAPLSLLRVNGALVAQAFKGTAFAILLVTRLMAELTGVIARNPPLLAGVSAVILTLLLPAMGAWAFATVNQIGLNLVLFASMLAANAPIIAAAVAIGLLTAEIIYFTQNGGALKQGLRGIGTAFVEITSAIDRGILRAFIALPRAMLEIGGTIIRAIGQGMASAAHGLFSLVASIRNGMIRLLNPFNWVFGSTIVDVYAQAGKEAGDALMRSLVRSFDAQIGAVIEAARTPLEKFRSIVGDLQGEMSRLAGLQTTQGAFSDLLRATLELRKLDMAEARANAPGKGMGSAFGSRPVDKETKGIDKQLTALDKLTQRRKLELDILKARGQLADKTLASDQQVSAAMEKLVGNIALVTDEVSRQANELQTTFIPSWELAEDAAKDAAAGIDDALGDIDFAGVNGDFTKMSDELDAEMQRMTADLNRQIDDMMKHWQEEFVLGALAIISLGLGPLFVYIKEHWRWETFRDNITGLWDKIIGSAKTFATDMIGVVGGLGGAMAGVIVNGFKDAWNAAVGGINALFDKIDFRVGGPGKLGFTIDLTGVSLPTFSSPNAYTVPASEYNPPGGPVGPRPDRIGPQPFASGGWIPGMAGMPVPIIAHAGEYVLSRNQLRSLEGIATLGAGTLAMLGLRAARTGAQDSRMINYGHQTFTLPEDTNAPFVRAMMRGLA